MGGCGGTSGTGGAEVTGEEDQLGDRQELATVGGWDEECCRHAVADASRSRGAGSAQEIGFEYAERD